MIVSISEQAYLFFISVTLGFAIAIFFDFFRVIRLIKKYKNRAVYIQDLIFIITIIVFSFYIYLYKSNGAIREYYFLGIFLGALVYFVCFSSLVRKIMKNLLLFFLKVFEKFTIIIFTPLKYIYKMIKPHYNIYKGKTSRKLKKSKKYINRPKKYFCRKYKNFKRKIKIIFEKV